MSINTDLPSSHRELLQYLGIPSPITLGSGMQSMVYDFGNNKIIKIYTDPNINLDRINELRNFYQKFIWQSDTVSIPEIFEVGEYNSSHYSIERKLSGERAHVIYRSSNTETQHKLLDSYFSLLSELQKIEVVGPYGEQLTGSSPKIENNNWRKVLEEKLEQSRDEALSKKDHDIDNISDLFDKYFVEILPRIDPSPQKNLIHGDLFLENLLANRYGEITALLDFGPLTLIGDHLMDVTGLVYFPTVTEGISEDSTKYLLKQASYKYKGVENTLIHYLLYYCLYFINSMSYDPRTYVWCKRHLTRFGFLPKKSIFS